MRTRTVYLAGAVAIRLFAQPAVPEVRIRTGPYAPPGALISVQSNLVEMTATVRDRAGQLVAGLTRADFAVFDDGKPREIAAFSEQHAGRVSASGSPRTDTATDVTAPPPRAIALFFDDMHIAPLGLSRAKTAAHKLVDSKMRPGDRLAVYTDSGEVVLDLTTDKAALASAIERIKAHPQRGSSGVAVCPTLTPYQAYVIAKNLDLMALNIAVAEKIACDCSDEVCAQQAPAQVKTNAANTWDVFQFQSRIPLDVLKIIVRGLSRVPGQRIVLMVSPGFITGGMERETAAITEEAVRAHVVISALDSEGLMNSGESPESKPSPVHAKWAERTQGLRELLITGVMAEAAESTGGQFVKNTNDFIESFDNLTAPPEVSYLIAFAPAGEPDGRQHPIALRLTGQSNYRVETRRSYFSARPEEHVLSVQDRLDRMAASNETANPFPTIVRLSRPAVSTVRVDITVDLRHLKFSRQPGLSLQELTFLTLLEDAGGNFIAGKQSVMDLRLSEGKLAELQKDGLHAATTFSLATGSYRVREIVREVVENRIAASNTAFEAK